MVSLGLAATAPAERECRIRGLALQAGVPATVRVTEADAKDPAGVIQVKSFLNHEFDTLKLKGDRLVFTDDANPGAEALGSCDLPAKAVSVILVFVPEGPGKTACKVVAVEDGAKDFPAGSFKVVNLSSLAVKIELEKKPFEFQPGEIRSIEDPPVGATQSSGMRGYCLRDEKWQSFAAGIWPHPGTKRVLQVLTENPVTKQVEMKGVRDVAAP